MSKTYTYFAEVAEGPLYSINAEDGPATTFDCGVVVYLAGGEVRAHATFHASGKGESPDGWVVARSRARAQAFADRVNARGEIDLDYWVPVPEENESLEERWAGYAREEQIERCGRL